MKNTPKAGFASNLWGAVKPGDFLHLAKRQANRLRLTAAQTLMLPRKNLCRNTGWLCPQRNAQLHTTLQPQAGTVTHVARRTLHSAQDFQNVRSP